MGVLVAVGARREGHALPGSAAAVTGLARDTAVEAGEREASPGMIEARRVDAPPVGGRVTLGARRAEASAMGIPVAVGTCRVRHAGELKERSGPVVASVVTLHARRPGMSSHEGKVGVVVAEARRRLPPGGRMTVGTATTRKLSAVLVVMTRPAGGRQAEEGRVEVGFAGSKPRRILEVFGAVAVAAGRGPMRSGEGPAGTRVIESVSTLGHDLLPVDELEASAVMLDMTRFAALESRLRVQPPSGGDALA